MQNAFRSFAVLSLLLALTTGCPRDLDAPPQGQRRNLVGRVVIAESGTSRQLPVQGAYVELLRTNLSVQTGADGRFSLGPLPGKDGTLSVRYSSSGSSAYDKQRQVQLSSLGAGGAGDVQAGDLLLAENGFIRGRAALADSSQAVTGHAGITVYVPDSPFTAVTSDNGLYTLRDLPAGTLEVAAFRPGYQATSIAAINLASGQILDVRELDLPPAPVATKASVSGLVARVDSADASGLTVKLLVAGGRDGDGTALVAQATTAADGSYAINAVTPGLYDLSIAGPGLSAARLYNVLLAPGAAAQAAPVQLAPGQGSSSGVAPSSDGGVQPRNQAPVAVAVDLRAAAGSLVRLDGSGSSDPDGDPLVYTWVQTAGPTVALDINGSSLAARPIFTAPGAGGRLAFQLTVTDPLGLSGSATAQVLLYRPPNAVLPYSLVVAPGSTVTLDGTQSTDPDALGALTFRWTVLFAGDAGPAPITLSSATAPRPSFTAPANGTIARVQLVVSDGVIDSAPAVVIIYSTTQPLTPIARTGPDLHLDWGQQAVLDPSASVDPNSPASPTYQWQFSGPGCGVIGTVAAGGTATLTAPQGDCTAVVQLTVTDQGLSSSATQNIVVLNARPPLVTAASPTLASGAPAWGPVRVQFARAVDPGVADGGLVVVQADGGAVAGALAYDANTATVSFVPRLPFAAGQTLTATVQASSAEGVAMDGGYSFTFASAAPALQGNVNVQQTGVNLATLAVAATATDRWSTTRNLTLPDNAGLMRFRGAGPWAAETCCFGYGYDLDTPRLQAQLRTGGGHIWITVNEDGYPAHGEISLSRLSAHAADTGADRLNLSPWDTRSGATGPGGGSAVLWGATALDSAPEPLMATIESPDAGIETVRLWRDPAAQLYPEGATTGLASDWLEATKLLPSPTTDVLTGISLDATDQPPVVVWVDESAAGGKRLRGATYRWSAQAWTALPGQNAAGDLDATGDASLPTVRYLGTDIVVAYYHSVSGATDLRVIKLHAGTWSAVGAPLADSASPDLSRIQLVVVGDSLWLGFSAPAGPARAPHVQWLDPRVGAWAAPIGTGTGGQIPLAAGCAGPPPALAPLGDGAGVMLEYAQTNCSTSSNNSALDRDIR